MKQSLKWKTYLYTLAVGLLIGIGLFLGDGKQAVAAEALTIKSCTAAGTSQMALEVTLPEGENITCKIYRASKDPEKGGKFTLVDSFSTYGHSWRRENGSVWHTQGKKEKVYCYSEEWGLSGDVIFVDTGLKLGRTYYYKIVCAAQWEENEWESNIVAGRTVLPAPGIIKCCTETENAAKLVWTRTEKAQGYVVYRKSGKTWKQAKVISKGSITAFTDQKLQAGKSYQYKIRAYRKAGGKKVYSDYSNSCKVTLKNPTVKGNYQAGSVYGPSLRNNELQEVRRTVQGFKDNYIRKNMSDYEKVWMAFSYLRANCRYARKGWQYNNANTAWGALVYGEAQCSGFARGMKALCDAIGIDCRYVHADAHASNPSHQWNQVKVGGKWYILDAQGGFFLVGTNTWRKTGMSWNTRGLPVCSKADHKKGGFVYSII